MTQAGQVATVGLIGQAFFVQPLRCGVEGRGCGVVNLDALLAAVEVEQCEDFQFSDQFG